VNVFVPDILRVISLAGLNWFWTWNEFN